MVKVSCSNVRLDEERGAGSPPGTANVNVDVVVGGVVYSGIVTMETDSSGAWGSSGREPEDWINPSLLRNLDDAIEYAEDSDAALLAIESAAVDAIQARQAGDAARQATASTAGRPDPKDANVQ